MPTFLACVQPNSPPHFPDSTTLMQYVGLSVSSIDGGSVAHTESSRAGPSQPQVLHINPKSALQFKAANQSASVSIALSNPSPKLVAFKVKTTAPKRYCVRPNGGIIKGGENVSVSIIYQPGENNDAQERARHKFLVQAIFIDNEQVQLDQVWRDMPKERIMESKIRCQFEEGDEAVANQENRSHMPDGYVSGAGNPSDLTESMRNTAAAASSHPDASGIDHKELELRRLAEDYRRSQDEIANLRDENKRLRENGERMRKSLQTMGSTTSTTSVSSGVGSRHEGALDWKNDLTKPYIMGSILAAILLGFIVAQLF